MQAKFIANYRARLYTWGNTVASTPDTLIGGRDFDYALVVTDNTADTAGEEDFRFYVDWENPDASSSVTIDAMYGLATCTLTTGTPVASAEPTLSCVWKTASAGVVGYDYAPIASYDVPTSVLDA